MKDRKQTAEKPAPQLLSPAWSWLMNEQVPQYVKHAFSPRPAWRDKPFSEEDARFFFKGIQELSDLFTEDRPRGMPAYFQQPKFRSSYLLYFLPLQAAKFLTLFRTHSEAIEAALDHGHKTGVMRVVDLGAGPGTASLALLLFLLNPQWLKKPLPKIEFHWFDLNPAILKDGKALLEALVQQSDALRNRVTMHYSVESWQKVTMEIREEFSLVLMGHVMNENPRQDVGFFWNKLIQQTSGGGILMVEPAAKKFSQLLSQLRDRFFSEEWVEPSPTRIWGPCLHAEKCPMAEGKDWCHFSVPIQIPGKWFRKFSTLLGSERQWVKFSYFWLASQDYPSQMAPPHLRRVISDPLKSQGKDLVLLCEPERPGRLLSPRARSLHRGDLVKV